MDRTVAVVACAVGLLQAALAGIPLDGRVYDDYQKTQSGKERRAFLPEAFAGAVKTAVRLASGAVSDVEVVNGIPTFELAADDRADAYADAFELK